MPEKIATMLYDGDCGFCERSIERWKKITGASILYFPYQEALPRFPKVTPADCKEAVQLVLSNGSVVSGAHAVFKALDLAGRFRVFHFLYERLPLFGRVSEVVYQWVAHRRMLFSKLFYRSAQKCNVGQFVSKKDR